MSVIASGARLALLMDGYLRLRNGKMGFGLLRYGPRIAGCEIACVIDPTEAGGDLAAITGVREAAGVPIVASVAEALALRADVLVIAVATSGGVLPDSFVGPIEEGLRGGMSLVNGLHGKYADVPSFAAALQPGRTIWDVRLEPPGLRSGQGLTRLLPGRRVLTVGTDMAIGKMTASLEMDVEARRRGLRSAFAATGQIGICISGDGIALDAVRVDFASGAVQDLCLRLGAPDGPGADVVWVEGQGSALHPGSTAWVALLRGSMPTDLVLVARAGQTQLDLFDDFPMPPLPDVVALYEHAAAAAPRMPSAKVRAIALNCTGLSDAAAHAAIAEVEAVTGLPADDVVRHGGAKLVDAVLG